MQKGKLGGRSYYGNQLAYCLAGYLLHFLDLELAGLALSVIFWDAVASFRKRFVG